MIVFGFWTQTNICLFYSQNICSGESTPIPCMQTVLLIWNVILWKHPHFLYSGCSVFIRRYRKGGVRTQKKWDEKSWRIRQRFIEFLLWPLTSEFLLQMTTALHAQRAQFSAAHTNALGINFVHGFGAQNWGWYNTLLTFPYRWLPFYIIRASKS